MGVASPIHPGSAPGASLSLGSVDVVDGRQQLLASLLVDVRAQANVDQIGELLHGVLLRKNTGQSFERNDFLYSSRT